MIKVMFLCLFFLYTVEALMPPQRILKKISSYIIVIPLFVVNPVILAPVLADDASKVCTEVLENGDRVDDRTVSCNVPSRLIIDKELNKEDEKITADDTISLTLKLIPSTKYFKAIAQEYSSRSTTYKPGQENLFSPFQ